MSGEIDLSVCRVGDELWLRGGEVTTFRGPNPHGTEGRYPYWSSLEESFQRNGMWSGDEPDPLDVVRVTRDGVQVQPAVAAITDDPELDCTDGAHPAWWRGHDHTAAVFCQKVNEILDGKDDGKGFNHEPWGATRRRLLDLVSRAAQPAATGEWQRSHGAFCHNVVNVPEPPK